MADGVEAFLRLNCQSHGNLNKFTVVELKEYPRERDLNLSGNKNELCEKVTVINASAAVTLLEQRPEKNSGSERDSNPRPLRCQCSALSTELSKPHESARMRVSPLKCGRYTWPKYSRVKINFVH